MGNETFGTSKYNGRDPFFIRLSNEYTPDMQGLKDIKIADRFVETVNEMTMAIMWNRYKMIYTIDTELAEALSKTSTRTGSDCASKLLTHSRSSVPPL